MPITITITDPTPSQLKALVAVMNDAEPTAEPAAAEPAAKAKTPAKPKDEPKVEAAKDIEVKGADAKGDTVAEVPSAEDVLAAGKALAGKNGRDALVELLDTYGATQISALAEKDRAAFIAACEKATA